MGVRTTLFLGGLSVMDKEIQRESEMFLSFLACTDKWVIILFIRSKNPWKRSKYRKGLFQTYPRKSELSSFILIPLWQSTGRKENNPFLGLYRKDILGGSVRKGSTGSQIIHMFCLSSLDLAPGHLVLLASVKKQSGFHSSWYVRNLKRRRVQDQEA